MAAEKHFEKKIKAYLQNEDAWFVKFFANSFTKKGIPDVLACVSGYFIGIEVKAEHGSPTKLQIYHCEQIRKAGGFAFILYPSGFDKFKEFIENLKNEQWTRDLPLILK
jgi:Holliday junction resolvase